MKQYVKTRSTLQKEIGSICPICSNEDVEHFQIHHIDENREHNEIKNLILICSNCHSKITKGDIPRKKVQKIKAELIEDISNIECAFINIDREKCGWIPYDNYPNAFLEDDFKKDPFPILEFSLINHNSKTILLSEIQVKRKDLPGIFGPSRPSLLKSIAKFEIRLPSDNELTIYKLKDEIEVPGGQAFKFQVQIYSQWDGIYYPIHGAMVLSFALVFNNEVSIHLPKVFLNCRSDSEKRTLVLLN